VDKVPRAKEFYSKTLGFDVVDPSPEVEDPVRPAGFQLNLGAGTRVLIYPSPDHRLPTFPVLSLVVKDLGRAVGELRSRGIRFDSDENGSPMDPGSTDRTTDAQIARESITPADQTIEASVQDTARLQKQGVDKLRELRQKLIESKPSVMTMELGNHQHPNRYTLKM
jgi:hypothetical protein